MDFLDTDTDFFSSALADDRYADTDFLLSALAPSIYIPKMTHDDNKCYKSYFKKQWTFIELTIYRTITSSY